MLNYQRAADLKQIVACLGKWNQTDDSYRIPKYGISALMIAHGLQVDPASSESFQATKAVTI